MNQKMKTFSLILILIIILVVYPLLGPNIESVAINLGLRTFLMLLAIYIILILMKNFRK